jgi:biotin carboxyl carrier protein
MAVTKPTNRELGKPEDRDSGTLGSSSDLGRDAVRALRDHARSQRDHEAINRLADELLPALISRLSSSGLGEIEVREGAWKARLRKPAITEHRVRVDEHRLHAAAAVRPPAAGHRDDRDRHTPETAADEELGAIVASSPAVGVYTPRRDLVVGMRVRAGDRIGFVDVLGVQQDVLSPIDGVIGSSLAEAGEAVEYGQELVRIEVPGADAASDRPTPGQKAAAAPVAGRP